jgi:hypothetical protein
MAENAQIILNWTPVATATVQKIYRSSTSNSGPWTLVHTINNGTTDTWTDTTVDPTPMQQYYYYIETTCSSGTSTSNVDQDLCNNCDEGNGNKSLFIFKNNITNDSSNLVYFTYEHWGKDYWNNTFNTSLTTTSTIGVGQTPTTGFNKYIACHTCGEPVTMALPNPLVTPEGTYSSTLDADYTHASNQLLESYLPASASGFNQTFDKREWDFDASNNSFLAHTVNDGNFWLGQGTGPSTTTTFSAINPPSNYNIGEMQVNQMRISRKAQPYSGSTSINYSTGMSGFGTGSTPSYILMNYTPTNSCIFWLFSATRNTAFDVYSGATLEMYGYNIDYIASFVYDSTKFVCSTDTTDWGHLSKTFNQPFTLKFFTTSGITY